MIGYSSEDFINLVVCLLDQQLNINIAKVNTARGEPLIEEIGNIKENVQLLPTSAHFKTTGSVGLMIDFTQENLTEQHSNMYFKCIADVYVVVSNYNDIDGFRRLLRYQEALQKTLLSGLEDIARRNFNGTKPEVLLIEPQSIGEFNGTKTVAILQTIGVQINQNILYRG